MPSSKDVFVLRKQGSLNEAYRLATDLIEIDPRDEWNVKAFAWCIYDLVKIAVAQIEYQTAQEYISQLDRVVIDEDDDILFKAIEHAKNLAIPERKIIFQAKEQSKLGNHQEAILLFKQAVQLFPNDIDLNTQFAWELWKVGKILFDSKEINILQAKRLLADYIKLKNERPSQLHSLFLRFADKIMDKEDFNLIAFVKLWGFSNLREDDFTPYLKDGNTYPSIAEKIIQHAAKIIVDKRVLADAEYFLPHLGIGITKFPENIWLTYYKAKILHILNRSQEAIEFLIPVVKGKIGDYWTWSLLADLLLVSDIEVAISSYCKSLLCKGEEKFLSNVRLKLAEILIQLGLFTEAKLEIQTVIKTKESEGLRIPDKLNSYMQTEWFANAPERKNNYEFYNSRKQLAEEFIFTMLPWLKACLASSFTIPEKPDKPRRKLFVQLPTGVIIEVIISDRRFNTSKNHKEGEAIKVKGEYDNEKLFQIYLLEKRIETEKYDLFEWQNANILQLIQNEENRISGYRIAISIYGVFKEGIIDLIRLSSKNDFKEGQPVSIKYYQKPAIRSRFSHTKEKEPKMNVFSIRERASGFYWDSYPDYVGVIDHINNEKGIAHFIIDKQIDGVIKVNQLKSAPKIGDKVLTKLRKVNTDTKKYYSVLSCELTDKEPSENITTEFRGKIEINGSFGFASDVFIDNSLIQEFEIVDGESISGIAILNYNKRKGTWGWKAFSIY